MAETSTKPYLVRALYEWCCDNGYTPYLAVSVDARTRVPMQYVRNGEIVLNVSPSATHQLQIGNDLIEFQARFSGVAQILSIPVGNVTAIYARETGHGMAFEVTRPVLAADDGDELARRRQGQQGGDGERRRDGGDRGEGGRSDGGRGDSGRDSQVEEAAAGSAESGGAEVIAFGPDAARRRRRGDGGTRQAGPTDAGGPAGASGPSSSRSADRPARPARDERRGRRGEGRDGGGLVPVGSVPEEGRAETPFGRASEEGRVESPARGGPERGQEESPARGGPERGQESPARGGPAQGQVESTAGSASEEGRIGSPARPAPTVAPPSTADEPVAAESARPPRQATLEGFEGGDVPGRADDGRDATSETEPPDDDGNGGGGRPRLTRIK